MDPIHLALSLANIAPSLLRFFGAGDKPVAVAQRAIEMARAVTGKSDGAEALSALQFDPKLAHEYRQAVVQLDAQLETAYLADRRDARARDSALHQSGAGNLRANLMVIADVVGLIACLLVMLIYHHELPGSVSTLLTTIATLFGAGLRDAHQFEFGSSRGSREKNRLFGSEGARG